MAAFVKLLVSANKSATIEAACCITASLCMASIDAVDKIMFH